MGVQGCNLSPIAVEKLFEAVRDSARLRSPIPSPTHALLLTLTRPRYQLQGNATLQLKHLYKLKQLSHAKERVRQEQLVFVNPYTDTVFARAATMNLDARVHARTRWLD